MDSFAGGFFLRSALFRLFFDRWPVKGSERGHTRTSREVQNVVTTHATNVLFWCHRCAHGRAACEKGTGSGGRGAESLLEVVLHPVVEVPGCDAISKKLEPRLVHFKRNVNIIIPFIYAVYIDLENLEAPQKSFQNTGYKAGIGLNHLFSKFRNALHFRQESEF